jgi:putative DNA primase/helicase
VTGLPFDAAAVARMAKDQADTDDDWPNPRPLVEAIAEPEPYPLEALSPVMRSAVVEFVGHGQQPIPIVAGAALGAASLAMQGLADVERDTMLRGPVSLFLLTIAQSGERKTTADVRFRRAAREWQDSERLRLAPEVARTQLDMAAWGAEHEGIVTKIKRAAGRKGGDEVRAELKAALADLEAARPTVVVVPSLFFEDATPEALALSLATDWSSASLWSDEAGLVIGSHAMSDQSVMRTMGLLNRLWDGQPFDRRRATAPNATVRGCRITVNLMAQPSAFSALADIGGGLARGLGFLARFLLSWPTSTMGSRFYKRPPEATPALDTFDSRLHKLLTVPLTFETSAHGRILMPQRMTLSPAAHAHWVAFFNDSEKEIGVGGAAVHVADVASKVGEQAARIAAVLQVFENGPGGDIAAAYMQAGCALAAWHLDEARRILTSAVSDPAVADAVVVLHWLRAQPGPSEPRDILKGGPPRLRDKLRRDAALERLIETGHVREGKAAGRTVLLVNPKSAE